MKLRMIIADDEYNVRHGLNDVVPWDQLGIEVVGLAANGQESYELCKEAKPDILLTDIRMPMIDGLEAASRLKELQPELRIMIISAAQDFKYAQTAMRLEADGYLLKPIKLDELTETAKKVAASILEERSREEQLEQLESHLKESMPALREKFMADLIMGIFKSRDEVAGKLEFFGIPLVTEHAYKAALFQMDEYDKAVELYSEKYRHLLSFSVRNIIDDLIRPYGTCVAVTVKENEYAVLFDHTLLSGSGISECCQAIIQAINAYLKIAISAGIGNSVVRLEELHLSYREARSAMEYKFFTGKNAVIDINDFNGRRTGFDFHSIVNDQSRLVHLLKLGDQAGIREQFDGIFDGLYEGRSVPVGYLHSFCIELLTMASKTFLELGDQLEAASIDLPAVVGEIYRKQDVHELRATMRDLLEQLAGYMAQKHNNKNSSTIKRIKDIIAANYMENLTVARLAEEVYLSPNYISLIFKKETGEGITEYLTKVRMEAAKQLLKDEDLKILDVSEMVGYENATYFSTVFKKYTGVHPQKYRLLCQTQG